jgi:hypothetical protein
MQGAPAFGYLTLLNSEVFYGSNFESTPKSLNTLSFNFFIPGS